MLDTPRVITMQPVLETRARDDFALWPVADVKPFGFLALGDTLTAAEVGAAVMSIANCNDIDPEHDGRPPRPAEPLGSFLHGLLTFDVLFAAGGLCVTDTVTSITLLPGCCNGLEDWRDWYQVLDGSGQASFGHNPAPLAERHGDIVRLTIDTEQDDSPTIDLPVTELWHLLAGAEHDLANFLSLAADWLSQYLPAHASSVTAALARALDTPPPIRPLMT
jgi:hypothetical protein